MKRRAFTLIELLVIVAVIAIIAAVLFPIFFRKSEPSGKSRCQNNLKQIALGFKQYINDFDERYPIFMVTGGSSKNSSYGWADALQPYIKNTQVYQCSTDVNEGSDDPTKPNYTDYWYNANFMVLHRGSWKGAAEAMLDSPAQTIISGDGGNTVGNPTGDGRYNVCGDGTSLSKFGQRCAPSSSLYATFPAAQLHLDGANFAYADGHVKWLRGNNPTQSVQVLSNSMTRKTIAQAPNSGKATFSLLAK